MTIEITKIDNSMHSRKNVLFIVNAFLILSIGPYTIEGTDLIGKGGCMAIIIPFKTRQQLETEKAMETMQEWDRYLEWEDANWQKVVDREVTEEILSQEEIKWLNDWVGEKE